MAIFEIRATLLHSKKLIFENSISQNSGEHVTTSLVISIPKTFQDFDFFLEFSCPQGKRFVSPKLVEESSNDESFCVCYQIENVLLQNEGLVFVQLVARLKSDNSVVFRSQKSGQSSFFVTSSIVADSEIMRVDDYFTHAEKRLNETEQLFVVAVKKANLALDEVGAKSSKIDEACESVYSLVESLIVGKAKGDFKGDKGEKGDSGKGVFGASVENGDLILFEQDVEGASFSIRSDGFLVVTIN